MGAAKKLLDKKTLKDLVPLNALSAVHLEEISRKAIIETVRSGRYVFKLGDRDYQSVYLLEGKVELIDGNREVVGTVVGGSDAARHPLAHKQPRQIAARASGSVTVARIDSSLLDVLLTWDESSGYDVVEIGADDDGDWMTRMLQSQAFLQLPPSNIHQLLMRLQPVNARAGDVIVRQGDDGDYFYIVKSGRMAVSRKPSARSKDVLLAELGEGACFGEEALVSGSRRNATVTMLTDGSLMRLSKEDFDELLRTPLVHEVDYAQACKLVEEGAEWLDVRLPGEYANQCIPGSRNLPLSALREQAGSLDAGHRYIVCCDTGRRSASAAFILSQHGLDVYTLAKGLAEVPTEELSGDAVTPAEEDKLVRDAEILPFEQDGAAAAAVEAAEKELAAREQELQREIAVLREQLEASEAAGREHRDEADALRERVAGLEARLQDAETQRGALDAQLQEARQLAESAREAGKARDKALTQLQDDLERVREDYQQLGQRTSAVAGERDEANRKLEKALTELNDLKARLDSQQGEVSEQLRVLREQLEARGRELETETARRAELEPRLATAEEALASASTSLAAAEARETELLARIEALETQQAEVEQQAGEQAAQQQEAFDAERAVLEEQLRTLREELEGRQHEHREALRRTEQEKHEAVQALAREKQETLEQIEQLKREYSEALDRADSEKQQALERLEREKQDALDQAAQERQDVLEQLEQERQAHRQALEQARAESASSVEALEAGFREQREALEARIAELEQAVLEKDTLAEQLHAREQALTDARQQAGEALEQLDAQARELDALRQSLEEATGERDALQTSLDEKGEREQQLEQQLGDLEQQMQAREAEFESDLGSAREAMSRAQTELDNLKREQQRVLERLRKSEEALERERHDREDEVRRLHREMKEAAGGSAEGLAEELETLQKQLADAARLRDDLEIKLGERSAQYEEAQERAEQVARQLELARQSAREAEQQLLEATRAANEEMEIRLRTEQGIQEDLRKALETAERERNAHQETITVIQQELEELREAWQQARQAQEAGAGAQTRVEELEAVLASAQGERDAALASVDSLQRELDQLRAESEVRRGLDDMLAGGADDDAENEALQQAKQNVEVAVRLRAQAEAEAAALRAQVEELKAQLEHAASDIPMPVIQDTAIPSLDEDPAHAPDHAEAVAADSTPEAALLPEEPSDESVPDVVPASPRAASGGLLKGLAAGLLVGAMAAGGVYFWKTGGQAADALPVSAGAAPVEASKATVPKAGASKSATPKPEPETAPGSIARKPEPHTAPVEAAGPKSPVAPSRPEKAAASGDGAGNGKTVTDTAVPAAAPFMRGMPQPSARLPASQAETAPRPADEPAPVPEPRAPVAGETMVKQPAGRFRDRLASGGRGPEMVRFNADRFLMGASRVSQRFEERPQHEVSLDGFAMSAHEVTFDQYDAFARATGRSLPDDRGWGRGSRPVINVSWEDARAYAGWLSAQTGARYRLPTEAEWEFVARSGTGTRYWWGDSIGQGKANCFDCGSPDGGLRSSPVGSFAASPWGVHDMAGNVREWVRDCYVPNYKQAPVDGSAVEVDGCRARVVRGGAYSTPSSQLRSSSRGSMAASSRVDNLGFRVVREN